MKTMGLQQEPLMSKIHIEYDYINLDYIIEKEYYLDIFSTVNKSNNERKTVLSGSQLTN